MASSSRVFILLGLMLAIVLLISSSEVTAARDLAAETKEETAKMNGVKESKHGRSGSDSGGCRGQYCGKRLCCTGEAKDAQTSTEPQN